MGELPLHLGQLALGLREGLVQHRQSRSQLSLVSAEVRVEWIRDLDLRRLRLWLLRLLGLRFEFSRIGLDLEIGINLVQGRGLRSWGRRSCRSRGVRLRGASLRLICHKISYLVSKATSKPNVVMQRSKPSCMADLCFQSSELSVFE